MIEVVPGIYQLQLPLAGPSAEHVNVYLVRGDRGCLLVDTGWDTKEAFDALKRQLHEIGLSPDDIKQVVITHCHTDHFGMADRLKRSFHTQIYMHKLEMELIKSRFKSGDNFLEKMNQLLRTNGVPQAELVDPQPPLPVVSPVLPDVVLQGGDSIPVGAFGLQVLWTPGHSPGHISLYEPAQRLLFSGDLILPTIASNIGLHLQYRGNPLGDYLGALNMVKQLDVKLVLPGHEYIFSNLLQRIEELVQHHKQKGVEIMATIADAKQKTAYQVCIAMSWSPETNKSGWESLSPWDKRFAVLETIAHLEFMRFQSKVDRLLTNGMICYCAIK